MTKLGDRLKQGLTEAITMAKLMRENEGLKAHNKELRKELRKCHQMLVNQARTIMNYQLKEEADGRDGHENRPTDSFANSEG